MALDGRLVPGKDGVFGEPELVKSRLGAVFPGTPFHLIQAPPVLPLSRGLLGLFIRVVVRVSEARSVPYPRWEGSFDSRPFAAEFRLGAEPPVRKVDFTLYGAETTAAEPYFDALYSLTGWRVRF